MKKMRKFKKEKCVGEMDQDIEDKMRKIILSIVMIIDKMLI